MIQLCNAVHIKKSKEILSSYMLHMKRSILSGRRGCALCVERHPDQTAFHIRAHIHVQSAFPTDVALKMASREFHIPIHGCGWVGFHDFGNQWRIWGKWGQSNG